MLVAQGALIFGALAGLGVIKNIDAAEVVSRVVTRGVYILQNI